MFEISGTVKKVFDEQTFGSGFNKREFVLTVEDGRYPQDIVFETVKDKTSLLDGLQEGEQLTVSFDIRGREWKERYFVNLNAWKLVRGGDGQGSADKAPQNIPYEAPDEEDVPF
jgi:hypothetical protein